MSMYRCRYCENTGHLSDNFVGYVDENGLCFSCFKKLPGDEAERICLEIQERKEKSRPGLSRETNPTS